MAEDSNELTIVTDIGGKGRINATEDLLKVVARTPDKAIEATESQYGIPITTFQFHPEISQEQENLRNQEIFAAFIKSAESHRNKQEVVKSIPEVVSHMDPTKIEKAIAALEQTQQKKFSKVVGEIQKTLKTKTFIPTKQPARNQNRGRN